MTASALVRRGSDSNLPKTTPNLKLWLDARRPRNYDCLHLPGSAGYYASTPDSAALSITGDIDIRCKVALTDWTPSPECGLVSKYGGTAGSKSYILAVQVNTGKLRLYLSADGTTAVSVLSSVAPTVADGATLWCRATWRASDGRTQFFTSSDGSSWAQLGTDVTLAVASIHDNASTLEIGSYSVGNAPATGKFYRVQIRNNILDDGTGIVFDADFTNKGYTFTESSSNAATVTCNGRAPLADGDSLSIWADLSGNAYDVVQATAAKKPVYRTSTTTGYLTLPGVAGNYASSPDSAAVSVTGNIDIRLKVALTDWTPAAAQYVVAKYNVTGAQKSYAFRVNTDGTLALLNSTDGTAVSTFTSTAATGFTDGAVEWLRATITATGYDVKFYTSDDGTSWSQLGNTLHQGGTATTYDGTAPLEIGSQGGGSQGPAAGKFYRAQIRNNVLDDGSGIVFDADFTTTGRSFLESSSNHAVVTINGTGARESVSTIPSILFDGVDDVLSAAFTQAQPLTVYIAYQPGVVGTTRTWVGGVANNWTGISTTAYEAYGGTALTTGTPTTAPHIVSAVYNGASSVLSVDGTAATGDANTNGLTSLNIGALNAASQFAQGAFQSVLIYAGAHSDNTRKKIERWLGRQYNVTVAQ